MGIIFYKSEIIFPHLYIFFLLSKKNVYFSILVTPICLNCRLVFLVLHENNLVATLLISPLPQSALEIGYKPVSTLVKTRKKTSIHTSVSYPIMF